MANEGYVPKLDGSTLCHAGEGQRPLLRKEQGITITQNLYSMFPPECSFLCSVTKVADFSIIFFHFPEN